MIVGSQLPRLNFDEQYLRLRKYHSTPIFNPRLDENLPPARPFPIQPCPRKNKLGRWHALPITHIDIRWQNRLPRRLMHIPNYSSHLIENRRGNTALSAIGMPIQSGPKLDQRNRLAVVASIAVTGRAVEGLPDRKGAGGVESLAEEGVAA